MKKLIPLFLIAFLFAFFSSAFSYEIQITGNIPLSDNLTGISINSSTGMSAAVSSDTKILYIIETLTNTVIRKTPLDIIPSGVAIDVRRNLSIVSSKDGTLNFIDLETGSLMKTISTGKTIHSIAVNKENNTLFIGNGDSLMVMDLDTGNIVKEASLPNTVIGMNIDNSLGYLLMTMEGKDGLFLYSLETLNPITEIRTGKNPSGVSVNPSTHIAVLTNKIDNSISIISLEDKSLLTTLSFYENPDAVAIDPSSNIALITHKDGIAVVKLENPVPRIDSLIPESSKAGDSGFTLSIQGSRFIRDSKAKFNLKELNTFFEDNYNLKALVPPEELLSPMDVPVSVLNPPPGGGISNSLIFKILNPVPQVESITPDIVALAGPPVDIKVRGKNFLPNSVVNLNGENLKTRFISSILLDAQTDLTGIKTPSRYPVTVINPLPVSFTSNVVFLNVVEDASLISIADIKKKEEASKEESKKGTGTLTGRILNTNKQPIEGVTVQIKNTKAETDFNGYFTLQNVPSGKQHLMIHGSTAKEAGSHYPTIPLTINIEADRINEMPFQIYLHRQKDKNFKEITPGEETILTDPEVPGFEMRIPKDVKITGWDGKPNQKVSVRTVPTDRLPVKPLPDNSYVRSVYMFYFDKVGGGTPDQPIPIKSPNDLGLLPGEKAVLWYYDESPNEGEAPNEWAIAGTGTVTSDGMYIVSDPGVGIPKFCCGATAWGGPGDNGPPNSNDNNCDNGCCGGGAAGGDPVDLSTGYFIHAKTDLYVPGIIPVSISRYYRSRETNASTFGRGIYFEHDWWLGDYGDMLLLIKPGNYQYRFAKQPDGTYINTTDPAFRGAVVTYNAADDTRTLRLKDGTKYKFLYKDRFSGELIEIVDRNGNKLTFTRMARPATRDDYGGYLTEITTPEGRKVTFNQNYVGTAPTGIFRTNEIVDHTGRSVKYTYETDPFSPYTRLKTVTYPDGSSLQYQYDSSGRMSGIINERGILEVSNEYNSDNRVIKQTHRDGGTYTFNYTVAGGYVTETSMTAPNGSITTWRFYDDTGAYRDGYVTKKITTDGTTIYEREAGTNLLKSVTDPLNRKISYTYYLNGLIKTQTDNIGNVTLYEYESTYGMPTKITDALGKTTTYTYTFSSGKLTKTEIKDPLLNLTTLNYNTYGKPVSITDPNGNTTTLQYDPNKPAELTTVIDPLNNTSTMTYDSLGRLSTMTDAKGKSTYYTYDPMSRITEVKDTLDGITRYAYGNTGNLLSVTDAKNQTIRYEYDERDRLNKMTDQLGKVETYSYNTSDNFVSVTDRKGQTTTYTYDLMNRVTRATYADGSYTTYTYDVAGRLTTITDSVSGTISYTYTDSGCGSGCSGIADKVVQEVTPLGTISYTYDSIGRRTSMTVAGQPVVNYIHDAAGRLTKVSQNINGTIRDFTIGYDKAGRRTSLSVTLPAKKNPPTLTTNYSYDTASRLLNIKHLKSTTVLENLLYEYDPNGNRTKFTRNAPQPFRDAVTNTSYNEANQMLQFDTKNMTYDENGNMTSVTNSCGTTNYTWDVRNRLVGINGYKSDCTLLTASLKYDALGRRIEKTINGVTTQYLYDELDIIQEKQNGTVTANYVRTLNIDEPLARIKGTTIRHYQKDTLGSVVALVDDTGAVKTTYTYDPFGKTTVSGEASDNPFQYTGRENDGTGLYYYRARYYSPELQRFISEDPIGLKGGINQFAYVGNNPVNRKDPTGLVWYGNWCGPGGSGQPRDCYDSACKRHDECYAKCGVDWLSRWGNILDECASACDKTLLKEWKDCACSHGATGSW